MRHVEEKLLRNESLKNHCTLQIGGSADFFVEPSSETELTEVLAFIQQKQLPYVVVGRGSNILFRDGGFRGVVIKLGSNFASLHIEDDTIKVKAGAWMPHVARAAQANGLSGLEHTIGIPGSIGGMVVMNGGSQRKAIGSNIKNVRAMLPSGEIVTITSADCNFGYRSSVFQNKSMIVLEVTFQCQRSCSRQIRNEMLGILRDRRKKFPLREPNCGSVFMSNPSMYDKHGPPGKIIESLGLKGKSKGGIYVSEKHANFFVNRHNGSAKDFLELVEMVNDAVYIATGSSMMAEVRVIGNN